MEPTRRRATHFHRYKPSIMSPRFIFTAFVLWLFVAVVIDIALGRYAVAIFSAITAAWALWIGFQSIAYQRRAAFLLDRVASELAARSFDELRSLFGKGYHKESHRLGTASIDVGWTVTDASQLQPNKHTEAELQKLTAPADTVDVIGYVDFITLAPFTKVRCGMAFGFRKDAGGRITTAPTDVNR